MSRIEAHTTARVMAQLLGITMQEAFEQLKAAYSSYREDRNEPVILHGMHQLPKTLVAGKTYVVNPLN